nr:hypothetical protein DA06_30955 [Georgenia sp. SUBG003]
MRGYDLMPFKGDFSRHEKSPKRYQRDYNERAYHFYDFRWRNILHLLPDLVRQLDGTPTTKILSH